MDRLPAFLFYMDPKSHEVRRWAGELAGSVVRALRRPVTTTKSEAIESTIPLVQPREAPAAAQSTFAPQVVTVASESPSVASPSQPNVAAKPSSPTLQTATALRPLPSPPAAGSSVRMPAFPQLLHRLRLFPPCSDDPPSSTIVTPTPSACRGDRHRRPRPRNGRLRGGREPIRGINGVKQRTAT